MSSDQPMSLADRRPTTVALAIFLGAMLVYHANGRALPEADCFPPTLAAWTFVRHGHFDLREHEALQPAVGFQTITGAAVEEGPDGRWVSRFPPGSAWSAVPFVAPLALVTDRAPSPRSMGKFIAASYVAGAVVLFYFLCRALAPRAAGLATLCFGFGTNLWSTASQALWMHGPATFWLTLALYVLIRGRRALPAGAGAGLALGLAVATRPSTALFAAASVAALAWNRRWTPLAALGASLALPIGLLAAYNMEYFGRVSLGGYEAPESLWTTPLWLGLPGLLVSPSRGLLVYSVPLVLAPWGLGPIRRTGQAQALLWGWLTAAAATLVLYSLYVWWWGGWCYGPRYLIETLPVWCLLFGLAYARFRSRAVRALAVALVGVAIFVHLVGVFGHQSDWHRRHGDPGRGEVFFQLHDMQIEAHVREVLRRCGLGGS